jgi:hypothetical protein
MSLLRRPNLLLANAPSNRHQQGATSNNTPIVLAGLLALGALVAVGPGRKYFSRLSARNGNRGIHLPPPRIIL